MPADTSPITVFGPDFPFDYERWITHDSPLGELPEQSHGHEVAILGAGVSGMVAAWELMRLGLKPVIFEAGRVGGRLRSEPLGDDPEIVAEMGGMRFPESASAFFHYVNRLGLQTRPFPNPLTEAAGSTVIELAGESVYATRADELPAMFGDVAQAWRDALQEQARFRELQAAIRARDPAAVKTWWNPLVQAWDDRTFYDFIASAPAFRRLNFSHRELFGQVGFGTGGWDSDFRNSMLEILRVVATECDDHQHLIVGGAEQLPRGLWHLGSDTMAHWPAGTTLAQLHEGGSPRSGVRSIRRAADGRLRLIDTHGVPRDFDAVLATCQSWLLTTGIDTEESLFSQAHWMALDRTSYMQSSKTFVMVDRPFWKDIDATTGRHRMSMTLTDRLTRGTYLFEYGDDKPAVICLTYSWMADALKMLPLPVERRVELALDALQKIYPSLDIRAHIVGQPRTVSWEADPHFLGAFKGALPGHYRYNRRMFTHFMQQEFAKAQRGLFIAGDDVSWTPGWAEGAVQTALNAVWGMVQHFEGNCPDDNPGPGDLFEQRAPLHLPD